MGLLKKDFKETNTYRIDPETKLLTRKFHREVAPFDVEYVPVGGGEGREILPEKVVLFQIQKFATLVQPDAFLGELLVSHENLRKQLGVKNES